MRRPLSLLAASPPLLIALLIARFWLTGTLGYYVNNRTVWIVLVGGCLFALVGVASIRAALRSPDVPRRSWRALAFVVPLVVTFFLPPHPLSATTGQAGSLAGLQLASHVSVGTPGDQFGTWITALVDHPDPNWWVGQRVTLVGFAARQVGLPPRSFLVSRFLVTCCVVDASLLGFPVQIDGGKLPAQGAWVQIRGVFGRRFWTDPSGGHYPLIQHARLVAVSVPSSPYLSP